MSEIPSNPETEANLTLRCEGESFAVSFRDLMMSSEAYRKKFLMEIPMPYADLSAAAIGTLHDQMSRLKPGRGRENLPIEQTCILPFLSVDFDRDAGFDGPPPRLVISSVPFKYAREGRLSPEILHSLSVMKTMVQLLGSNSESVNLYPHIHDGLKAFFVYIQRELRIQNMTAPPFDPETSLELLNGLSMEPGNALLHACREAVLDDPRVQHVIAKKNAADPELRIPPDRHSFAMWLADHEDDLPMIHRKAVSNGEALAARMKESIIRMHELFGAYSNPPPVSSPLSSSAPPSIEPRLSAPVFDTSAAFADAFRKSQAFLAQHNVGTGVEVVPVIDIDDENTRNKDK
ncbi:MAG TPA: hypothetical protein VI588_02355 [Candidatus Gracilibacteria bacterium]|nr:hypothetical protein [Candidatus Gracilibacteria bacterium]